MPRKDPRVNAYIGNAAPFARPILKHLRKIVHAGCPKVEETIRWGFPHFLYKGLLCAMGAFKQHCAFWFWNRTLVLGKTAQKGMAQYGKITSIDDLPGDKTLIGHVRKAVKVNERGVKPSPRRRPAPKRLSAPSDLKSALGRNVHARKTFEGFSYSHKKEYVEWITSAKRDETRRRRLRTAVQWLAEGKPQNWRYL